MIEILRYIILYFLAGLLSCIIVKLFMIPFISEKDFENSNVTKTGIYLVFLFLWPIGWISFLYGMIKGIILAYRKYKLYKEFSEKLNKGSKILKEELHENSNKKTLLDNEVFETHDISSKDKK